MPSALSQFPPCTPFLQKEQSIEISVVFPLSPPHRRVFDPSSPVRNDGREACPWLPLCDPCSPHWGNDDLVLYIFLITCPLGRGTTELFFSWRNCNRHLIHTPSLIPTLPIEGNLFQNEVGIPPPLPPFPCIPVSFAGGQETLWSRRKRGKDPNSLHFSSGGKGSQGLAFLRLTGCATAHLLFLRTCFPPAFPQGQGRCCGAE